MAALEAVHDDLRQEILRWLRETSDLQTLHTLTLRPVAHIGHGPDLQSGRRVIQYQVLGLPPGQDALIADFDGGWRILRCVDNQSVGQWGEPHVTPAEALETLAPDVDGAVFSQFRFPQ